MFDLSKVVHVVQIEGCQRWICVADKIFIERDREAGEIIRLVAAIRVFVCLRSPV